MISLKVLFEEEFKVPMINKTKVPKLNPKTNRMKNSKITNFLTTNIHPEERTMKNLPRYANKKPKVRFQDWLEIKAQKRSPSHQVTSYGWAANGKCYGWSHRAMYGFKKGDIVKPGTSGYNGKTDLVLKSDKAAEEMAKKFAEDVS